MGRGRAKAKQTRVARELKYHSPNTDLAALQRELSGGTPSSWASRRMRRVVSKIPVARSFARSKLKPSISSATWITPPALTT